jgi:hypothetical protein
VSMRGDRKSFAFNIWSVENHRYTKGKSNPSSSAVVKTCALAAVVSR